MEGYEDYRISIEEAYENAAHEERLMRMVKVKEPVNNRIKATWVVGLVIFILLSGFIARIIARVNYLPDATITIAIIVLVYLIYRTYLRIVNKKIDIKEKELIAKHKNEQRKYLLERTGLFNEFVKANNGKVIYSISGLTEYGVWREENILIMAYLAPQLLYERISIDTIDGIIYDTDTISDSGIDGRAYLEFMGGNRMIFTDKAYKYLCDLLPDQIKADLQSVNTKIILKDYTEKNINNT